MSLSSTEQDDLRTIMVLFFPGDRETIFGGTPNEATLEHVETMLIEADKCTAISKIPTYEHRRRIGEGSPSTRPENSRQRRPEERCHSKWQYHVHKHLQVSVPNNYNGDNAVAAMRKHWRTATRPAERSNSSAIVEAQPGPKKLDCSVPPRPVVDAIRGGRSKRKTYPGDHFSSVRPSEGADHGVASGNQGRWWVK